MTDTENAQKYILMNISFAVGFSRPVESYGFETGSFVPVIFFNYYHYFLDLWMAVCHCDVTVLKRTSDKFRR